MSDGQDHTPDAAGEPPVEPDATGPGVAPTSGIDIPESDLDALLAPPAEIAPVDPEELLRGTDPQAASDRPAASGSQAASGSRAASASRPESPAMPAIPKHDPIPTDVLAPSAETSTGTYRWIAALIFGGLVLVLIAAVVFVIVLATGAAASDTASAVVSMAASVLAPPA